MGLPHEHQNPNAGIVWDEEAVYASLAKPPNGWDRDTTFHNIIRKISPAEVQGSEWDRNSIMHYPFEKGLILQPPELQDGLNPAPGLSALDKKWVKETYPSLDTVTHKKLQPFKSVSAKLKQREQLDFTIQVEASRKYQIATFGESDTVMVLFEDMGGDLRYVKGDDDSGEDRNAQFEIKLITGRKYVLRTRLYWQNRTGDFALMMW